MVQHLQFENNRQFLHRFTRLGKTRSLTGSGTEMPVAQTSTTTFQKHHLLTVFSNITQIFTGFGIVCYRTTRHFDNLVFAILTETLVLRTVTTVCSKGMTIVTQVKKCPIITVTTKDDMSSTTTVTAIRATIKTGTRMVVNIKLFLRTRSLNSRAMMILILFITFSWIRFYRVPSTARIKISFMLGITSRNERSSTASLAMAMLSRTDAASLMRMREHV